MTTINWRQVLKSPQAAISTTSAAVAILGTAGILNTSLSSAIQSLLVAVLGVITSVGHTAVSAKVAAKQIKPAQSTPSSNEAGA